jgi:hypothetical protein
MYLLTSVMLDRLGHAARVSHNTHPSTKAELVAANAAARELAWFDRLAKAWRGPFNTAALCIGGKPQTELVNGVVLERPGTIALGIDNKGCVDIGNANCITKLNKHLEIKNKFHATTSQGRQASPVADKYSKPKGRLPYQSSEARALSTSLPHAAPPPVASEGMLG